MKQHLMTTTFLRTGADIYWPRELRRHMLHGTIRKMRK